MRCGPRTANVPPMPLGDTLTCPAASSGALATKNTGWSSSQARSLSSIASNRVAMGRSVARAGHRQHVEHLVQLRLADLARHVAPLDDHLADRLALLDRLL